MFYFRAGVLVVLCRLKGGGEWLKIWLEILRHLSEQIFPLSIGFCCQGLAGPVVLWLQDPRPLLWFPNGIIRRQLSCCLLSDSLSASFTDKWAAAQPYGPLMVQLPPQSIALRAEGNGRVNKWCLTWEDSALFVCGAPWGLSTYWWKPNRMSQKSYLPRTQTLLLWT